MTGRAILSAAQTGHPTLPQTEAEQTARHWVQATYRQHCDFVWRSLRGLGVPEANVDDAVQEVFIVVYRRRHEFLSGGSEKAWLFRIAHFVARNHRRSLKRKGGLLSLDELNEPDVGGDATLRPDEAYARKQATRLLSGFLATLDEGQRQVFVSMEIAQLSAPETASALELKLNTVYSRLRLARKRFEAYVACHAAAEGKRVP